MTRTLHIAAALLDSVREAARRAHPNECCGLIEGVAEQDGWRATAVHETRNVSDEPSRAFLIDPEVQFRLLRSLRGTERSIIGCFHSHPDGAPHPSERDRREAVADDFIWLVVGVSGGGEIVPGAHVFHAGATRFEQITLRQTA